jgi:hypothetical protein
MIVENSNMNKYLEALNANDKNERLEALAELIALEKAGKLEKPSACGSVNNHIHTTYSFSPYSPTKALWMARAAGLITAGIMDHDSVGGCDEFVKAGEISKMAVTCGFETRVSVSGTLLEGHRLNNPDQISVAYVAIHGIPHQNFGMCEEFLAPFRAHRNERNRKMTKRLNDVIKPLNITLDFDSDIKPISCSFDGGSVTERHILFALSKKLMEAFGKGEAIDTLLRQKLHMQLSAKIEALLIDTLNPYYEYDLLGAMKSDLVASFYIDATDECPHVTNFIDFAKRCGGIAAYAYLGDVGNSTTGDKKTQKFEDDFIELLFENISSLGFNAVTYMPSRNTLPQLERVMALCDKHDFFQISGEDINTPRQNFICEALSKPEFSHLTQSTWALIGHEQEATKALNKAMFSDETKAKYPTLKERIAHFEDTAQK